MKKLVAVLPVSVLALSVLSACGDGDSDDDGATTAGGGSGAFPVQVETKFGEVTVEEEPKRVVALGWGDAEVALELGVEPVGASDWLGWGGEGVGPWSQGYTEPPEIIETLEPSYEQIAALEPDLILDVRSSGEQERYDRLSSIAPTIGVPEDGENYLVDSDDQVEMISEALGKSSEGDALLADADAAFEKAADAHPEWDDQTVTVSSRTSEGWGAYTEGNSRVDFMEELGFELSPKVAAMEPNSGGFSADVSDEQLDLLDADLLLGTPIFIEASEITDDPQWKAIPAVKDGRSILLDGALSQAFAEGTPAAQEYAIDQLVPMIEDTGVGQ
ncbi:ABC transporter substrate-binding protein [Nocardioides insulae]|uniref:ABC transporter substrate-binding protein n=1 Tax=Nocardioides insulae TaxID=394734 RepID=UPI00040349E6|nr:ABC transporter substrate-binding protein [Nocardioides insulae]